MVLGVCGVEVVSERVSDSCVNQWHLGSWLSVSGGAKWRSSEIYAGL